MLVVWGTKVRRKSAGFVAEICAASGEVHPHRLEQLREVPHVYYLGIGPGKVAGYQVVCRHCDGAQGIDPARYAGRVDAELPLDRLVELTHPGVREELEELKQRFERAKRGELAGEERIQVMQEALLDVRVAVEQRAASGGIDARSGLLGLATLIGPTLLIAHGAAVDGETWVWAGAALGAVGAVAMVHAFWTRIPRFIRRTQGEPIQAALAGFHPSPAEIDQLLVGLRAAGTALGKRSDREWWLALFHSPAALSGRPIG